MGKEGRLPFDHLDKLGIYNKLRIKRLKTKLKSRRVERELGIGV
jgi:hypothetical protein